MQRRTSMTVLGLGFLALCGLSICLQKAHAQEATVTDEFRQKYIKDFHRIGLNTAVGDAMLLRILVESSKAKRGIEVGTSTGYGALNMGLAFERNGGQLVTLDIDPEAVKTARGHIEKMGLQKTVTVVEGDALKTIPQLEGEFDFIFIDALKRDYLKYLQAALPKLKPGALIIADNVIQSAKEMPDYLDFVQKNPDYHTVIIRSSMEKNDGMAVTYKLR
jgi:caffeoyl-CoA O-methyltransferase